MKHPEKKAGHESRGIEIETGEAGGIGVAVGVGVPADAGDKEPDELRH
jgi:hypothetical protein